VVPEPTNESTTRPSGLVSKPIKLAASCEAKRAGCQWKLEKGESLKLSEKSQSTLFSLEIKRALIII
jgi:hypothetical protein